MDFEDAAYEDRFDVSDAAEISDGDIYAGTAPRDDGDDGPEAEESEDAAIDAYIDRMEAESELP